MLTHRCTWRHQKRPASRVTFGTAGELFVDLTTPMYIIRNLTFLLATFATAASAQTVDRPGLIHSDTPFTPTAVVDETESGKRETGELNGVIYRFYYSDGSGIFVGKPGNAGTYMDRTDTNWDVQCKKDPVTDRKHCQMKIKDLWLFVYPKGRVTVSIGHEHYPGSSVTIRIDQGAPISTSAHQDGDFNPQTSLRLVQQLKKAKSVTTRYMKWPYRSWDDETWELYGFNEALAYATWAVDRIK